MKVQGDVRVERLIQTWKKKAEKWEDKVKKNKEVLKQYEGES